VLIEACDRLRDTPQQILKVWPLIGLGRASADIDCQNGTLQ
jgi:hypothetical protein